MNRPIRFIFLAISFIVASSCLKEKREVTYNNQESKIDQYISNNMYRKNDAGGTDTLRVVYRGGASRLVTKEGHSDVELKSGGTVSFYYAGYTFTNNKSYSNLFTTNHEQTAELAGWNITDPDYEILTVNLADDDLLTGLKDGLTGVRPGEECQILFSGKYGFGKKPFGIISADSALLFEIWVIAVDNE